METKPNQTEPNVEELRYEITKYHIIKKKTVKQIIRRNTETKQRTSIKTKVDGWNNGCKTNLTLGNTCQEAYSKNFVLILYTNTTNLIYESWR